MALAALAFAPLSSAQNSTGHVDPHVQSTGLAQNGIDDFFPPVALALGLGGHASLHCIVALDGSGDCTISSETPANMGFGAAALALSRQMRFAPATENGQPVAGGVDDVNIDFPNQNRDKNPISPALVAIARPSAGQPTANGRALVDCTVRTDKHLDCGVEAEAPAGAGVGDFALHRLLNTWRPDGPAARPYSIYRIPVEVLVQQGDQRPIAPSMFSQRPTQDEMNAAYPWSNGASFASGHVVLLCTIQAEGRLACTVMEEHPNGVGFGDAAIRISSRFVVAADQIGRPGIAVGDKFMMPITFTQHPAAPPPPQPQQAQPAPH